MALPPSADPTRKKLVTAAEALFAEHGIEAVSLRSITRAAGQRNANALQYHFGDRSGLVRAVLEKHNAGIDPLRWAMLDSYEQTIPDDQATAVHRLAAALVEPSASKLSDPDGGRDYLRIFPQLLDRPGVNLRDMAEDELTGSISRWRSLVAGVLPAVFVETLHRRFTALRFMSVELARRASASPSIDDSLFVSHLTDLIAATLSARISQRTSDLLDNRARHSATPRR